MQRKPFVAVVGASGSGKSSVVRAGLVPRLRSDRRAAWETVILVPIPAEAEIRKRDAENAKAEAKRQEAIAKENANQERVSRNAAEEQARIAQASEKKASDARDQDDGLINFMLYDLRDKLEPIGRLDILGGVAKKAKEYLDSLPKELVTTSRLEQQAAMLNNLGNVLLAQGNLQEALDAEPN